MPLLQLHRPIEVPPPEAYGYVPKNSLTPIRELVLANTREVFNFSVTSGRNFSEAAEQAQVPSGLIGMSAAILEKVLSHEVNLDPDPKVFTNDTTVFELVFSRGTEPDAEFETWHRYPEVGSHTVAGAVVYGTQLELLTGRVRLPHKHIGFVGLVGESRIRRLNATSRTLPVLKITKDTILRRKPNLDDPQNLMFAFRATRSRSPF